jgi:hypothetical protein
MDRWLKEGVGFHTLHIVRQVWLLVVCAADCHAQLIVICAWLQLIVFPAVHTHVGFALVWAGQSCKLAAGHVHLPLFVYVGAGWLYTLVTVHAHSFAVGIRDHAPA